MDIETWKQVKGYEGIYEVSNTGVVRSVNYLVFGKNGVKRIQKGRVLKLNKSEKGYIQVTLSKNLKRFNTGVHRLVAISFIENPYNKQQVNHIDGNKENNHISNLEWVTNQENQVHSYKNKLSRNNYGESHHMAKLKNIDVFNVIDRINNGETMSKIAKENKMSVTAISNLYKRKTYININ